MSSIYLVSPAGHPNFGDELIAAAWLRHLAATRPDVDVWLDCPNPGLASELFLGLHPRLHVTNTLWRSCWEASSTDLDVVMRRVADLVTNFGSPAYDLGLERLRKVESIHLLGGGYLNDLWPFHAGLVAGAVAVQSLTGAKLYGTGLSVVPMIDTGTRREGGDHPGTVVELLQRFDHVSVRDQPSAEFLGVPLGLDDAFLGVLEERDKGLARGGADLVLCLQSDLQSEDQSRKVIDGVRATVAAARAEGRTIQYVEAIPGVDRPAFDALADLMDPDSFIPFLSVWRDGLPLRADQTWLTTRFHLHFLAAAAGAAGTAIGVKDGFYDVKHQSLRDLGTGWSYLPAFQQDSAGVITPGAPATGFTDEVASRAEQKRQEALDLYPAAPGAGRGQPDDRRRSSALRFARGIRTAVRQDERTRG
ncbi:polysaccharide pyruvyl transferase family protein [Arthrobacter sp. Ld5]|uniref:polysaccharide pyruvyl transferase family protein n=1 Tax=Arthrobacter sp. Ld5 TaxID=649152 RepID=UPI003EB97156